MKSKWFSFLILTLATFALYFQTLFFDLTFLDDHVWILDYQHFFKDWSNAISFFTQPDFLSSVFYRPVLNLSFMVDAHLYDFKPWGYHLTNIILHALNSCLIFLILDKISANRRLAFWLSLIFCIHPVHVSAVAWIPGRTDTLLAAFVFSSFLFFLNKKYVWHLIFFILALLTKETAVVLPGGCLIYSLVVSGQWPVVSKAGASEGTSHKSQETRTLFVVWFIILSLWFFIRHQIIGSAGVDPLILFSSLMNNLPAVISYFGKVVLPVNLSVLPHLADMTMMWGWVALAIVGALQCNARTKQCNARTKQCNARTKQCNARTKCNVRMILFGLSWFLLFLLPSLVLSFLKHEYRLYVPMVGILIALTTLLSKSTRSPEHQKPSSWCTGALVCWCTILIIFSSITFLHSQFYRNRMTFWHSAVNTSPTLPLAQRNLGAMYYLEGEYNKAEQYFLKTMELYPNEKMVHNNLGLIAMNRGELRQAEVEYLKEIQINSDWDTVYLNLGILYAKQSRFDGAKRAWQKAVELNPNNSGAVENLKRLKSYLQ